jgi:septum site-determining protein MinC
LLEEQFNQESSTAETEVTNEITPNHSQASAGDVEVSSDVPVANEVEAITDESTVEVTEKAPIVVTAENLKNYVVIKGVKEGLNFQFNDQCEWEEILAELKYKLENTHQKLLSGTSINVFVKLGERMITENQQKALLDLLSTNENLVIRAIENNLKKLELAVNEIMLNNAKVVRGIVRSGQIVQHQENVLLIGDVNPGGTIISDGDVYILGSLRGIAHAGYGGNQDAVIVAAQMRPTQLRIADCISRPPDEWGSDDLLMEFAYLTDGQMNIDKLNQLRNVRQYR